MTKMRRKIFILSMEFFYFLCYFSLLSTADLTTTKKPPPLINTADPSKIIAEGPKNQTVVIGSKVQLTCRVAKEYAQRSEVRTKWLLDGKELIATDESNLSSRRITIANDSSLLTISQVGPDSVGRYECRAVKFDSGETDSESGWLMIYEKPGMSSNVRAELRNETSIEKKNAATNVLPKVYLSWTPGFDGNSPILRYSLEMRHVVDENQGIWSEWKIVEDFVPHKNATGPCCSLPVENFRSSSTAEFRVIAYNQFGPGRPSQPSNNITLPQQAPSAAPTQVRASARSSSSIMVQWQSPNHMPAMEGGNAQQESMFLPEDIRGYVIRYRLYGYQSSNWIEQNVLGVATRNALLEPLIAWREYEIQVAAFNDRGRGRWSESFVAATLEGVPLQAPQNVRVEPQSSTSILVSFNPPNQQMIPGVNMGYKLELWKGPVVLLQNGRPQQKPTKLIHILPSQSERISERVEGLDKYSAYNLTVLCFTAPGDGPRSDPLEFRTLEDIPGPIESLVLVDVTDNSAELKWSQPSEPNGRILKYLVRWWSENSEKIHQLELSPEHTNVTLPNLQPSTNYTVEVLPFTKIGAGPVSQVQFSSGIPPEIPGQPSPPIITAIESRKANVHFFLNFDGHSAIRSWFVEARVVGDSSIFVPIFNISNLPKAENSFTVDTLRPFTQYQLRLIAENVRGKGIPSEPSKSFRTQPANPERSPDRPYADPISDKQIAVNWTPLFAEEWNGEPHGYIVQYRRLSFVTSQSVSNSSHPIRTSSIQTVAPGEDIDDGEDEDEGPMFEEEGVAESTWHEAKLDWSHRQSAVLQDLKPYSRYAIRVAAENNFGRSRFTEPPIVSETYPGVPETFPPNIHVELHSLNSILVTWDALELEQANGQIQGYKISLIPMEPRLRLEYSQHAEVFSWSDRKAQFYNLRLYTVFKVEVSAFTMIGEGPKSSDLIIRTGEGVPEPPSNISFFFRDYNELRIRWDPPEQSNGELSHYQLLHFRPSDWPPTGRPPHSAAFIDIPPNLRTFPATNLLPNTTNVFILRAVNQMGTSIDRILRVFTSPNNPPLPVPPTPRLSTLHARSARHLTFDWDIPEMIDEAKESPIRCVEMEYQKADQKEWINRGECIPFDDPKTFNLKRLQPNTAYRVRIRFVGDPPLQSSWSAGSGLLKTLEAPPAEAPRLLSVQPLESTSALVEWYPLDRDRWNADKIGYKIYYQQYGTDGPIGVEELPPTDLDLSSTEERTLKHKIHGMTTFRRYVVEIRAVNGMGESPPSRPVQFLFIGYAVPKQKIQNFTGESLSSTSIKLAWSNWTSDSKDLISGYRLKFSPILTDNNSENKNAEEESFVIDQNQNEYTLSGLRKFTEYQISVSGHNRAGDGQLSSLKIRTLEDLPEIVGPLRFQDILLDSVNISWGEPIEPNGIIRGYVVRYKTLGSIRRDGLRKDIQVRTTLPWLFVDGLAENVTYGFSVCAETSAGMGSERVGNVTLGYSEGAPQAPDQLKLIPEQTTFLLRWKNSPINGIAPIKGYLIQGKRVGVVTEELHESTHSEDQKQRRRQAIGFMNSAHTPRHVIGQWTTLASLIGDIDDDEAELAYRQLEPASYYVFRVFSRNEVGISKPSMESEQLKVPMTLPEEPFYTRWWFLVIVALAFLIAVLLFAGLLFITGAFGSRKVPEKSAWDQHQLADGALVAYELKAKQMSGGRISGVDDLAPFSRPNTAGTWLSRGVGDINGSVAPAGVGIYGSIDGIPIGGAGSVINMYSALATDAVPRENTLASIMNDRRQSSATVDTSGFVGSFGGEPSVRVNPFSNFHSPIGSRQATPPIPPSGYHPSIVHYRVNGNNGSPIGKVSSTAVPPRWKQKMNATNPNETPHTGIKQYFLGGKQDGDELESADGTDGCSVEKSSDGVDESGYDRLGSHYQSARGLDQARTNWLRQKQQHQIAQKSTTNSGGIPLMPRSLMTSMRNSSLSSSTISAQEGYSPNPEGANNNNNMKADFVTDNGTNHIFSSFV